MGRFLVTGGAGFIGSHLSEYLIACGHEVTALDDLSAGSPANIEHLLHSGRFRLIIGSVHDTPTLSELTSESDAVFHLAASVGVEQTVYSPLQTIENNILGTHTVLRVAVEHACPVLLTSSSEVYGSSTAIPHVEDADLCLGSPRWSRWAYAGSKACEEYLAVSMNHECRLRVVIVRLFNVVGSRQSAQYGMVLPRFTAQAIAGAPITVHGSGEQRRCFLDVRDAVRALADLIACDAASGEIFNLGSEEECSILHLAGRVRTLAQSSSDIVHIEHAAAGRGNTDVHRRVPSLTKLRHFMAWEPQYSCDDSIAAVIEHLRQRQGCRLPDAVASVA